MLHRAGKMNDINQQPRSQIIDSRFHGGGYGTEKSREIFSDEKRLGRWLKIEAALAAVQGELGIIPIEAAEEISKHVEIGDFDLNKIAEEVRKTGHSMVGLLRSLEEHCKDQVGQYVHYGATTQDIQDTGQSLEMQDVFDQVLLDIDTLLELLGSLAETHRTTVMVGRTHAQPALPTTFGLKVAGWFDELSRQRERVTQAQERVLVVQLFGGVGTMSALGERGLELLERFADRLGLAVPACAWHVSRDRVAEFVSTLGGVSGTLARIADEIRTLVRPEFGELAKGWHEGMVGSSTMPHKRNPELSEQIMVLARLTRALIPVAFEAMAVDHERDYRGTRLEWVVVCDASHYTLTALQLMKSVIPHLVVFPEQMRANAQKFSGAICTEAVMFALASHIGKQSAHALVYSVTQKAINDGIPMIEAIKQDEQVRKHLSAKEIDIAFDPAQWLGLNDQLIDRALNRSS